MPINFLWRTLFNFKLILWVVLYLLTIFLVAVKVTSQGYICIVNKLIKKLQILKKYGRWCSLCYTINLLSLFYLLPNKLRNSIDITVTNSPWNLNSYRFDILANTIFFIFSLFAIFFLSYFSIILFFFFFFVSFNDFVTLFFQRCIYPFVFIFFYLFFFNF